MRILDCRQQKNPHANPQGLTSYFPSRCFHAARRGGRGHQHSRGGCTSAHFDRGEKRKPSESNGSLHEGQRKRTLSCKCRRSGSTSIRFLLVDGRQGLQARKPVSYTHLT